MTAETLSALANARDVAAAAPGLRFGVAFRSDAPFAGDDAPVGLAPWPPATVVDLRDADEAHARHPLADAAAIRSIPLLTEAGLGAAHPGSTLLGLYRAMISGGAARAVVGVATAVATAPGPVLVHCSAGKDRTGVSVALVLSLVGVERERIVEDYVATAGNMRGVVARIAAGWSGGGGEPHGVDLSRIPAEMLTAPAAAIEGVLDAWAAAGGAEEWFLAQGGLASDVDALRQRLLA
ncbi:tyrosine-protein phosphatase [Demequina sp. SYSU T00192]|uniref:Tyrosine-protein phosphatase n=1 Tax=Demequina litoralis TaxID=3051660 RepID=A0ABT8G6P2_9MICO|nr:tyrosine-protein phosphatase [Demequina sp. SYSU T00192]MDN4474805.1 tyrosine-protein phosphatase [Demequina sp. SYSU T00192]